MRLFLCFLLFPVLLLLSGCAQLMEKATLEDLGMVGVMGFDYVDDGKIKVTVAFPQPSKDAKENTVVLSTEAELAHEPIVTLSAKSQRTLVTNQLRTVLFSEELAKKVGIERLVKHLYRDPMVGDAVFVAIVKGSTEEIIGADYKDKPNVSNYLNDLLRPRVSTAFSPFTTIHMFIYDLTNEVSSPIVPYLVKERENIEIKAIALMKEDKMVGTITPEEAKIVQGLQNVVQIPSFLIKAEDENSKSENHTLLDFVKTEFDVSSNGDLKSPIINLDLRLTGSVVEYEGERNFETPKDHQAVEKAANKELKKQTEKLIKKFNEMEIDPIGLRKSLRKKYRGEWTAEKGFDALQRAEYNINVSTKIVSTGTRK